MVTSPIDIRIKDVLNECYGEFITNLEIDYENIITERLLNEVSYDKKLEWATYNQVVLELKNNLNDYQLVSELQYRLSDLEQPKKVCMEVITNSKTVTPELQRLYNKINHFID